MHNNLSWKFCCKTLTFQEVSCNTGIFCGVKSQPCFNYFTVTSSCFYWAKAVESGLILTLIGCVGSFNIDKTHTTISNLTTNNFQCVCETISHSLGKFQGQLRMLNMVSPGWPKRSGQPGDTIFGQRSEKWFPSKKNWILNMV